MIGMNLISYFDRRIVQYSDANHPENPACRAHCFPSDRMQHFYARSFSCCHAQNTVTASQLTTWNSKGVLAIWTIHGNTRQPTGMATAPESVHAAALSPLNSGAIRVTGQPGHVHLETADGRRQVHATLKRSSCAPPVGRYRFPSSKTGYAACPFPHAGKIYP